jgi:hypothetical protein
MKKIESESVNVDDYNWSLAKPRFLVSCTCGEIWFMELTDEQKIKVLDDVCAVLKLMNKETQATFLDFLSQHHENPHDWSYNVVEVAPKKSVLS